MTAARSGPPRRIPRILAGALAATAATLAGCTATPQPDPPSFTDVRIDPESGSSGTVVRITGAPGAAEPGGTVHAVNLDTTDPPRQTPIEADGRFELSLSGDEGDVVRLQVREGDRRSIPADVRVAAGTAMRVTRPLQDCLAVPLEIELGQVDVDATRSRAIEVQNDCGEDVVLSDVGLRAPSDAFALAASAPIRVAPGSRERIELEFSPSAPGPVESIVLLQVGAPEAERRPVTAFGGGR